MSTHNEHGKPAGKNRPAGRPRDPIPFQVPDHHSPPPHLSPRECLHWNRYLALLQHRLTPSDLAAFEQLTVHSSHLEELQQLRREGGVQSHFLKSGKEGKDFKTSPLMLEIRSTTSTVISLLREFGLTPQGRTSTSCRMFSVPGINS